MANNRINKYIGAMVMGTVLMAVPGCTDTWDDHYKANESAVGATQTLWEVISSNPQLSKFRTILQNANYYKDNTHPVTTYTFADLLSGGQVNTVWVPDDNALSDEEYMKWMTMLASSKADGDKDVAAGYNVQQQLLFNHIALWRHNISEPGIDTVKMMNGKNLIFDKSKLTLQDVPLGTYNIPTVNGVMHILKGLAPFHYNFYEYLKFGGLQTEFSKYVVSKDTTYFFASGSIEGIPDENGNPTYVDSVYVTSNRLFQSKRYLPNDGSEKWLMYEQGFGEFIDNEDSLFAMIIPTDLAWNDAVNKLAPSHKYAPKYEDKEKGNQNTSNAYLEVPDVDSLQNMSISMDIVSPLVYVIREQPKRGGSKLWTKEMFIQYKGDGGNPESRDDYLLNSYGDTLRNIPGEWDKTSLFDAEPKEMSNGIAYEVDSWNFPSQYYTPDVEVEIEGYGNFYNTESTKFKIGPSSQRYTFPNSLYKDITDKYGVVSNNNFFHLEKSGATAGPKVEIILEGNNPNAYVPRAQVMSGKYDVQLVLVPHWYIDIATESKIPDKFYKVDTLVNEFDITDTTFVRSINENYVDSIAGKNKYKFNATMSFNSGAATGKDKTQKLTSSKGATYDGLKVDTITVIEDFEFPFSYKNLRKSYPTLYIEGAATRTDNTKDGYVFDLVIDKIILKRKD